MTIDDRLQSRSRGDLVEAGRRLQQHPLVEGPHVGARGADTGDDGSRFDDTRRHVARVDGIGDPTVEGRGERGRGAQLEDIARADREAFAPRLIDEGDRDDAVAAEREEVVGDTHPFETEDAGHQVREGLLEFGTRRDVLARRGEVGLRQCTAVELAVRGEGERSQDDERRRHHVLGELVRGPRPQAVGVEAIVTIRNHVRRKIVGAGRGLTDQHRAVPHGGVGRERRLDVLELETHASDLDLVVGAAEEVEAAVRAPARQVAGAVEAGTVVAERVRDEA